MRRPPDSALLPVSQDSRLSSWLVTQTSGKTDGAQRERERERERDRQTHTHTHTGAVPPFLLQAANPLASSFAVPGPQHAPELRAESADTSGEGIGEMSAAELERQWMADAEERERMELLEVIRGASASEH